MVENIVIFGAGAQARYVVNTAALCGANVLAVVDLMDNPALVGKTVHGVEILGGVDAVDRFDGQENLKVIVAVGDNDLKRETVVRLEAKGLNFHSSIHPSAVVAATARVGAGCIINANVTIEPDARVDDHAVIHAGCVVEHDCVLGRYANLGPGVSLAGRVTVGEGAYVYTGASIIPGIHVGDGATVGAGACVIRSVAPGTTVVGVPASETE